MFFTLYASILYMYILPHYSKILSPSYMSAFFINKTQHLGEKIGWGLEGRVTKKILRTQVKKEHHLVLKQQVKSIYTSVVVILI